MSNTGISIVRLDRVDARLEDWRWPFAEERRAEIDLHWRGLVGANPRLFNGSVLLQHESRIETGADGAQILHARYFRTDYASFVARRAFEPRDEVRNGFAMAALRAADGAFLLGQMGPGTFNAGRVYFACGTPDPDDLMPDGGVDLAGSAMRELEEETGLMADEVSVEPHWEAVFWPGHVALMRPTTIDLPADAARRIMLDRIARQIAPELADVVIIRDAADLDRPNMAPFMQAYLGAAFRS